MRASFALLLFVSASVIGAEVPRPKRLESPTISPPRFTDADRPRKLAAAFPEIERLFNAWVERQHIPGAAFGVIIDGDLVLVKTAGVRDISNKAPVTPDTLFRIASMTKSFTAMSILKLRDEGKLSLDDPVARYIPELAELPYPTGDSPVLTIRHLLTHSEGFPEDNPWGDRQLAQTDETLSRWMRAGIPFSNAPGVAYEYSNYGFGILGQIVARVSGRPYADYVRTNILTPLGMTASTFDIPHDNAALGYRWEDGTWKPEPILPHGAFGSMGGLWTTPRELAHYVAFLMSAFPPRDDPQSGPIRRASAREMQQAWRWIPGWALRTAVDSPLELNAGGYAYGLRVSQDCRFSHIVGHGGGLPGYGSLERWLPEYGVGLIAFGNLTYAGYGGLFNDALTALLRTGALQKRAVEPSAVLLARKSEASRLINRWDAALASNIVADNFFLDQSAERIAADYQALKAKHGECRPDAATNPENALRGTWRMTCERGWLDVAMTLAPTEPPRIQSLNIRSVLPPDEMMVRNIDSMARLAKSWDAAAAEQLVGPGIDGERMRRQLAAVATQWGDCKVGEVVSGDGTKSAAVRLTCDRGDVIARLAVDPATHRLTSLDLVPARDKPCVP
jgi:CubicO group peptidase (beta-lactamase class C family)